MTPGCKLCALRITEWRWNWSGNWPLHSPIRATMRNFGGSFARTSASIVLAWARIGVATRFITRIRLRSLSRRKPFDPVVKRHALLAGDSHNQAAHGELTVRRTLI